MERPLMIDINLGLRRGELLGLKWKHIDFENKLISIEDNVVEVESDVSPDRIFTKAPKSQSGKRVIPISSTLNEYLKKAHKEYLMKKMRMGVDYHDSGYVVCKENGEQYKPNSFTSKFKALLKKEEFEAYTLTRFETY